MFLLEAKPRPQAQAPGTSFSRKDIPKGGTSSLLPISRSGVNSVYGRYDIWTWLYWHVCSIEVSSSVTLQMQWHDSELQ